MTVIIWPKNRGACIREEKGINKNAPEPSPGPGVFTIPVVFSPVEGENREKENTDFSRINTDFSAVNLDQ